MTVVQTVSIANDKVVMIVTDEVEAVGRVKVRRVLTFLYAELCQRKVYEKFHCEGCEMNWPSQRDHECCMRTEDDIFDWHYDDVKNDIDLDVIHNMCELFTVLVDIPMTSEWNEFISNLPNISAHSVFSIWQDMMHSMEVDDEVVTDFVNMMCNIMQNSSTWEQDTYVKFKTFMTS